jgi:cell wall-associated NlpC family hydrolase
VASLEAQISQQQNSLDQADEQYNQAVVNLTSTRSSLQTTSSSIDAIKTKLTTERSHLRDDAIQAYIGDTSSEAVSQIFAAPNNQSQISDLYQEIGAGNVAHDVAEVQANQTALTETRTKLLAEQQRETAQAGQEDKARQSAAAASAASEATLTQVQGTLADQIAQQAAAQAAAAARSATAATTPAAAQAAASQAAQAADVASTVSGGSAAADSAAAAASQAAGSAGGASFGYGGNPTAAGLAAVHGAMKYLGVPYVWGGASFSGVDCSGLTLLAWAQAGVSMPHSAADQYAEFPHVSVNDLEPGDLLFYDFGGSGIDHVVMYVGPTLDGQSTPYGAETIIQAAHTGTVVTFDPVFSEGFVGAAQP